MAEEYKIKIGPALWRQSIGDIPVKVIEHLGIIDGKNYYLVEGTNDNFKGSTGVPDDELIQEE